VHHEGVARAHLAYTRTHRRRHANGRNDKGAQLRSNCIKRVSLCVCAFVSQGFESVHAARTQST
jgi:hypothetical protein